MKVIDALKLIDIDVTRNKCNALGNALLVERYWEKHIIDFNKDVSYLSDNDYSVIQSVYIPKTIHKRTKEYGSIDLINKMRSILKEKTDKAEAEKLIE